MNRRPNAADLDQWLATLTPEQADQLWRCVPTGLADQLGAAQQESHNLMAAAGLTAQPVTRESIPEWVRLGALDTLAQWAYGTAKTCMHDPHPDRPEPVWSCAWRPNLVVCTACLRMLKVRGKRDWTCDRCGHLCSEHDPIETIGVWLGPLNYQAGACSDCLVVQLPRKDTA